MLDPLPSLQRLTVALVAVAVAGLVALAPLPAAGGPQGDPPRRWSGYAIPANGDADGGWIGGYRVGRTPLFVTTPTKRRNRAGYDPALEVGDLPGRRASRAETARAAWILSKYGGYRDATQAAAVDASVYHLLVGGPWEITGPRGARRIRQSGDRPSVARFARIMLRQSRTSAGRYTAELTASSADVGGSVAVTLTVADGHGRPVAGLPVTLAMAGVTVAPTVTGDDGRAVARFAAGARGWQGVTATVGEVPEHHLRLRAAEKKGQASAAEGGVRRTLVVSGRAAVRGPQTLSVSASPGTVVAGTPVRVSGSVGGSDGASRPGTATLHGPFPSAAAAHCDAPPVATVTREVGADGTYDWPAVSPGTGGYHVWRVAIVGTDTSLPVAACGAPTKVLARTTVTLQAPPTAASFDVVSAQVTVAGLPFAGAVDVTTTLYGPYVSAADACTGNHRQVTQRRPGNGTFTSQSFQVDQPGWYAWRASVTEGDLWLGSTSPCGVVGTLTQVQ